MKTGQFQTYILALLLIISICGTSAAVSWDISDYYHVHTLSIEQPESHDIDMYDVKIKHLVHPAMITAFYNCPLPEPAASILNHKDIRLVYFQPLITSLFPTRASPA